MDGASTDLMSLKCLNVRHVVVWHPLQARSHRVATMATKLFIFEFFLLLRMPFEIGFTMHEIKLIRIRQYYTY